MADNELGETPPALMEGFNLEDYLEGTTPSTAPEETPPTPVGDTKPEVFTLSKENLYQDIRRLAEEDSHFAEVVGAYSGRKASSKYESKIAEYEAELAQYRRNQEKQEILSMEAADIDAKFASDPEFARRYTELIHSNDQDITQLQENLQIAAAINKVFDSAYDVGLTPEQETKFREDIKSGKYDEEIGRAHV